MITLDDIVERLPGHRYEHYIAASCIFHDDSHPSLMVYEDGYFCLSCGARGSLSKLYKKLGGIDLTILTRPKSRTPWGRWLQDVQIDEFCQNAHQNLIDFPQQRVYLRERHIDNAIHNLCLGWIEGYYIFPITDRHRNIIGAVARAGRSIQEERDIRYLTPPNQAPQFYVPSWGQINCANSIYFTFGIVDAICLYLMNIPAMTWSTGKNPTAEAFDSLRKRFIFVPDKHEEREAFKIASQLGWRGDVKILDYPDDSKDISDVYTKYGSDEVLKYIQQ